MNTVPALKIQMTTWKGRGLFAAQRFLPGDLIIRMEGWLARTDELNENWLAVQVGPDAWLCSEGDSLDDCGNHSCDPNAGFSTGEPILHALRTIEPGEEICWDYSTSISFADWSLDCRCGSSRCRGTIRPWGALSVDDRERLRPIALNYLRNE